MKNIDKLFDFTVMAILAILWMPFNANNTVFAQELEVPVWDTDVLFDLESPDLTEKPKPLMMVGKQLSPISTYCNDRFDFCMAYPSDVLSPIQAGDNSDGKVFASENEEMHVWIYGTHSLNWTLEDEYKRVLAGFETKSEDASYVVGKKTFLADDYFVVHRWLDDQQYYQKTFQRADQFITISFQATFNPKKGELIQDVRQKVINSITL